MEGGRQRYIGLHWEMLLRSKKVVVKIINIYIYMDTIIFGYDIGIGYE